VDYVDESYNMHGTEQKCVQIVVGKLKELGNLGTHLRE
jgi:hypothetical protein